MSPRPRRPLGLVLAGGGALGAWQAGALAELERAGLRFDAVLGFSAGAINGAAYALGLVERAVELWPAVQRPFRLSPRLRPFSLCSFEPLREVLDFALDDEAARRGARCRLLVASAHADRCRAIYAEFDPNGRWDGPLERHLLASCAIPSLLPPVEVRFRGLSVALIDGGVPTAKPFSFAALGPCADVLVLEMARPDETARPLHWNPWLAADQRGRRASRRLIDEGAAELARRADGPRVFRVHPSRELRHVMLDFTPGKAREALALGAADARSFLDAEDGTAPRLS